MTVYDYVIIGFGKAGKTFASFLASRGVKTALIEKSKERYGGTCINVACIPSKSLEYSARLSHGREGTWEEKEKRYAEAVEEKNRLTAMLRGKNYDKLVQAGVTVYDGTASFVNDHEILISSDGKEEIIRAEHIVINTGAAPVMPPVEGLDRSAFVYTSETLMDEKRLPRHLVILGAGYIGLEFASYYNNFGSQVTVIQKGPAFLPKEDRDMAAAVKAHLEKQGIRILEEADILQVEDEKEGAQIHVKTKDGEEILHADALLAATGRRPNVSSLGLDKAGVEMTPRGAVKVDSRLHTSKPHIMAAGDVTGGMQFTYISLDDFRILKSNFTGDLKRTTENRGPVPYALFLDPPLARAGMTEEEARASGRKILTASMPAAAIPKAHVLKNPSGLLKIIVDQESGLILGAHFFCLESYEMINLVRLAMDRKIPYTVLRDSIYTHPTMTEGLNDLLGML